MMVSYKLYNSETYTHKLSHCIYHDVKKQRYKFSSNYTVLLKQKNYEELPVRLWRTSAIIIDLFSSYFSTGWLLRFPQRKSEFQNFAKNFAHFFLGRGQIEFPKAKKKVYQSKLNA